MCVAIFEAVKTLFDLRSTHCIITESLLNLLDCVRFGISKQNLMQQLAQYYHVYT
jgi:hypothetical protein